MRLRRRALAMLHVFTAAASLLGCGSPSSEDSGTDAGRVVLDAFPTCAPGTTRTCACALGTSALQSCLADGTYGPCDCDASVATCVTGRTERCSCPNGSDAHRTCYEGAWSACDCYVPPPFCDWRRERCNDADDDCDGRIDEDVALCPFVDDPSATLPVHGGAYVGLAVHPVDRGAPTGVVFRAVVGTMSEIRISFPLEDVLPIPYFQAYLRPSDGRVWLLGARSSEPTRLYDAASPSTPIATPFDVTHGLDVAFDHDAVLFAHADLYRDQTFVAADVVRSFVSPARHLVVFRGRTAVALDSQARQEMAIDLSGHGLAGPLISTSFSGESAFVLFEPGMLVRMDLETHAIRSVRLYVHTTEEQLLGALSDGRVVVAELARRTSPQSIVTLVAMDGSREVVWSSDEPLSGPVAFGDLP